MILSFRSKLRTYDFQERLHFKYPQELIRCHVLRRIRSGERAGHVRENNDRDRHCDLCWPYGSFEPIVSRRRVCKEIILRPENRSRTPHTLHRHRPSISASHRTFRRGVCRPARNVIQGSETRHGRRYLEGRSQSERKASSKGKPGKGCFGVQREQSKSRGHYAGRRKLPRQAEKLGAEGLVE